MYNREAFAERTRREFRQLLSNAQVFYCFQPIFSARSGRVVAYEALLRSDLPALRGTFSLGPVSGVVIQLVKNLLHLPFGSSAGVGELSNFILGAVFVLCAGLVYRKHKSRKGALIGAMLGAVLMAVVSVPSNYFFVYPAYGKAYGMPLEAIIGAYQAILCTIAEAPSSNALLNCLLVFNLPFAFFKGMLDAVICFAIYKPLSPILHGRNSGGKSVTA